MLVCNVSLRPPRAAILAAITEVVTAVDATATGNVVFATLVDDPASVDDRVDAYLGEILIEAASASDSVAVAGSTFAAAVDELVSASDAVDIAASTYGIAIDEAATAADAPDATSISAVVTRSAMVPGALINTGVSREASVIGTMVNL